MLSMLRLVTGLLVLLVALAGPVGAKSRVPADRQQITLSFAPVVKKVVPAVVNVYAEQVVRVRRRAPMLFDDPFFRRFFGDGFGGFGMPRERLRNSLGSGVIISPDGYIVTNWHVVENADKIRIVLSDRREFRAKIVLRDQKTDLAILKVRAAEPLPYLKMGNSDALEVGDLVLAIGNPFGVGQTVTQGIVSALARSNVGRGNYQFFIQTDAAINPGNSGGALVNMAGELIGINTMIVSRTGGNIGIGFAVPSNIVRAVIANAAKGKGRVLRPWAGVTVQSVSQDIADSLGLKRPYGALILKLHPASPLRQAGLRRGDVILAIDGKTLRDANTFGLYFNARPLGTTARLKVLRAGREMEVTVVRRPPPERPPRNATVIRRGPLAGAEVMNLSPAVADELGLPAAMDEGVIIGRVLDGPAARYGLRPGDVIVSVNRQPARRVRDVLRLVEGGGYLRLVIRRGNRMLYLQLG
ncbi:MAG TPA: Do family serine endopeptidase [Thermopetrobacter sp.]|nr:Do family serine endopeptidase [Thermopetrobacter sp.]